MKNEKASKQTFWFEYAVLVDIDGEVTITRMVKIDSTKYMGRRFSSNILLYKGGTTSKIYVKSWERLEF